MLMFQVVHCVAVATDAAHTQVLEVVERSLGEFLAGVDEYVRRFTQFLLWAAKVVDIIETFSLSLRCTAYGQISG